MAAVPENLTEKLDTLYSTTWQSMKSVVIDNIYNATPFWFWLNSAGRIESDEGKWIGEQILYGKNTTVKSIAQGGTIDISPSDPLTTAKYDWKWVAGSVLRLYALDHITKGKAQIIKRVDTDLKNLELSMVDALEAMVFSDGSGNGGLDLNGILAIVKDDPSTNPSSGAVGGIDAVANTWWRNKFRAWSVVGLPTGDKDILFNFRILYNTCSIGNDHPTLVLTDQTVYERYEACLVGMLNVTSNKFDDAGFEALRYKGAAVVFSPSSPSAKFYMLNERYLKLKYEATAYFDMTDWKPIPNQLDRVAQVVLQANMVTNNRRMHGVCHTIT
jgi:hypothetical protein